MKHFIIALGIALICSGGAYAQSFCPGAGVTASSTASVNAFKSLQVFLNYNRSEIGVGDVSKSPTFGLTYGLAPRCTISAGVPYLNTINNNAVTKGYEDMTAGFSYLLTPPGKDLGFLASFGAKPQTTQNPTLSGNGAADYSVLLAATYNLSKKWSFSANYGWDYWGKSGALPANTTPFYMAMFTYNPSSQFSFYAEYYALNPQHLGTYSSPTYWDAAASWNISKKLNFQAGTRFGLNSQATKTQYLFSLNYYLN